MATHSSILAWEIKTDIFLFPREIKRSLVGYIVHVGHKESDMTEQAHTQTAVETVRDCDFLSRNTS